MNQVRDPIARHLEALTPEVASADFRDRVMARIEESTAKRARFGSARRAWAVATVAAAAIVIGVFLIRADPTLQNRSDNRSLQLAEMRRQHALLKQELGSLRTRAQETAPVIYLGSVDDIDYVWDLTPLLERQAGAAAPASTRNAPTLEIQRKSP